MTSWLVKITRYLFVTFGIILLTSFSIDAFDTLSLRNDTFLAQIIKVDDSDNCPDGMIEFKTGVTFSCVDEYEASSKNCNVINPANEFDTEINISDNSCVVDSVSDQKPWVYIDREQAALLCARSGKRLPTAIEWYRFALGTEIAKCNINSGKVLAQNEITDCVSASGVKNTIGNVWEWVADDVMGGIYNDRKLPESGYVVQVGVGGVPTITSADKATDKIKNDYFWSESNGFYGMIRGGFYSSREDAGIFSIHAATAPNFKGNAVGFRCVK
jgi:formylglycine-generating enzyme required for sulfatase activity